MLQHMLAKLCARLPKIGGGESTETPGPEGTAPDGDPGDSTPRRTAAGADTQTALAPLLEINGIGPRTVDHLAEGGYTDVEAVRAASEDDLAAVAGVGRRAARTLKAAL